jgi:succinate-semialdehyde dehydrogenase/glutarate-semialdehyde dehydrogenase
MGTAEAAHHYATTNPYTGERVREFDTLDGAEVDQAVQAAHQAFGRWRRRPIGERAAIVHRAGELLAERRDRFAQLVTLEIGKLIGDASRRGSSCTTATRALPSRRRGRSPPTPATRWS